MEVQTKLACFRLSDGGEDAKVKGTRKVGGAGWFPPFFFMFALSDNSADPTISEPGTGKTKLSTYVPYMCNSKPVIRIVGASCPPKLITLMQRAKKVVSDSPGLVDFAFGLVNSVLNLSDGQVNFLGKFKLQKDGNQSR